MTKRSSTVEIGGKRKNRKKKLEETTTTQEKTAVVWSNQDEIAIMEACLKCAKDGLNYPENVPQVIESVKDSTSQNPTRKQMYEKIRWFRKKYVATLENMKKTDFQFNDSHHEKIFKLWKSAWPEPNPEEQQPALKGSPMEVGQEQPVLAGNPVVNPRKIDSTKASSSDAIVNEFKATMKETFKNVITMLQNSDAQTRALVENVLKSTSGRAFPVWGGSPFNFSVWGGSPFKRLCQPPLLDAQTTQMLKEKWDHQHILEMEIYSERLTLLREECLMDLEERNKPERPNTGN